MVTQKVGMKRPKTKRPPKKPSASDKIAFQRQIIRNIEKKVSRGGIPTPHEAKALSDFYANTESKPGLQEWVSSYEALGEILGCHRASFPRWRRIYEEAPKPRANGDHSVDAWRQFFKQHPEIRGAADMTVEMQQLELEEMRQRVRKILFNNDVREGSFTPNAKFAAWITKVVAEAKALLRQKFEHELPGYTAKQEPAQVRVLNKRAVDEICDRLGQLEIPV